MSQSFSFFQLVKASTLCKAQIWSARGRFRDVSGTTGEQGNERLSPFSIIYNTQDDYEWLAPHALNLDGAVRRYPLGPTFAVEATFDFERDPQFRMDIGQLYDLLYVARNNLLQAEAICDANFRGNVQYRLARTWAAYIFFCNDQFFLSTY